MDLCPEEHEIIIINPKNTFTISVLDRCLETETGRDAPSLKRGEATQHHRAAQHVSDNMIWQLLSFGSDLCNCIVRAVGCLHALIAADPHSNVSRLDHPHVIGTVPNGKCYGIDVFLDHVYYFRLL